MKVWEDLLWGFLFVRWLDFCGLTENEGDSSFFEFELVCKRHGPSGLSVAEKSMAKFHSPLEKVK